MATRTVRVSFVLAKSIPPRGPLPQRGQEEPRESPQADVFPRQMFVHAFHLACPVLCGALQPTGGVEIPATFGSRSGRLPIKKGMPCKKIK